MIDIEATLTSAISTALRAAFPNTAPGKPAIWIFGEEGTIDTARMPCVIIAEMSNTTYRQSLDSAHKEHHNSVMWQIDFYSNLANGGNREKCKAMAQVADDIMVSHNFVRTFFERTPSGYDEIYRMTARYTAVVSEDYRVYQ